MALHAVAHEPPPPARVVTFTAALAGEVPAASVASTVKLYAVDAASPLTANDVLFEVPIEVPFCNTV